MNNILDGYSKEEIESLAIKQLQDNEQETILKIEKIDKEYKKHNKQAVMRAVKNGAIIVMFVGIVLSSDSNISRFGTEDITAIFDRVIQFASELPESEMLVATYTQVFDTFIKVVDKIGLMGIILASKSINFVSSTLKDTTKSVKIKKELLELKQMLENKNLNNAHKNSI